MYISVSRYHNIVTLKECLARQVTTLLRTKYSRTPFKVDIIGIIAACPEACVVQGRVFHYTSSGKVMCNQVVEHDKAAFLDLSIAVQW